MVKRFQLSVASTYCPTWDARSGLREVLQNAADANDLGRTMTVTRTDQGVLYVSNEGVRLDQAVWLLGTSSKQDGRARGKFGEGLSIGVLALIRSGARVRIFNDNETWTPSIEASDSFPGQEVLTIGVSPLPAPVGKFIVEVSDVPQGFWTEFRTQFLFLCPPHKMIQSSGTTILQDEAHKGKIFVKGVFVQSCEDFAVGYDFTHVEVDRDRKMADVASMRFYAAAAWASALSRMPDMARTITDMLERDSLDVTTLPLVVGEQGSKLIMDAFHEKYGTDALGVTNMGEAREVEHYGRRGVVVPECLSKILDRAGCSLTKVRQGYRSAVTKIHSWQDLGADEQQVYGDAVYWAEHGAKHMGLQPVEHRLQIVDFNDPDLKGTYVNQEIRLARSTLCSFKQALKVLVHEVSHEYGSDGDVEHERAEGDMFSEVAAAMWHMICLEDRKKT